MVYIKLAVLAGGVSSERQISLRSGRNVAKALIRQNHTVALLDTSRYVSLSENIFTQKESDIDSRYELLANSEIPNTSEELDISVIFALKRCDRVFIALHGGAGEDGRLQSVLELLNIPYNGSPPLGCAVAMDKILTKRLLSESGILTPCYTVSKRNSKILSPPSYPCVVKPSNGGSSIGTAFASTENEHKAAVENAFKYCSEVLSEAVIKGKELTVGVLNDESLAVTEIIPRSGFYDYESKYIFGRTEEITPAVLPDSVTRRALTIAKRAHNTLGLRNFSRTDMIYEEASGLLYVLEVNTIPGMTETSLLPQAAKYCGIEFDELCERMM